MHKLLEYPFDSKMILKKKKTIKRELLEKADEGLISKKIAMLGGSTTNDIKNCLELFLLNNGITTEFYESEYAQYWQDIMFENEELISFKPDIIVIHTSNRNINDYPTFSDSIEEINQKLKNEFEKFKSMWDKIEETYSCPIIQNNFEYPFYRLMGNKDGSDPHGKVNFISRLNVMFYEYAQEHNNFFINDINYLSADYGLEQWSDPFYWHMYKYSLALDAIPKLAFSMSNIIKSIYGKNKKAFALDLDNTLWGGVIGDDGIDQIEIGQETSIGQVYSEFQSYLAECKNMGILLNIISKNDYEKAIEGLNHHDSKLKPEEFIVIKANWNPKCDNLNEMANELTLTTDSFVFVDDNPAEREIVKQVCLNTAVPTLERPEHYINVIDKSGFFEVTNFSSEDIKRNDMYKSNLKRSETEFSFKNYGDYLLSLNMDATIEPFEDVYLPRIAQLTNKSNQFNLTTKRYSQEEIQELLNDEKKITLYGRLVDKFGDNGIVSLVVGEIEGDTLSMGLWLMSCRVLKRDMEFAMMDELVKKAKEKGLKFIKGLYFPTAKNAMVKDFYEKQGFKKIEEDEAGNTVWIFDIENDYKLKNNVIKVN